MSKYTIEINSLQQDTKINLIEFEELDTGIEEYFGYIYYLISEEGEIVYIGKTISLRSRIASHLKDKIFKRVWYKKVSLDFLDEEEKEQIIKRLPKYNKTIPNDPFWMTIDELQKKFPHIYTRRVKFLRISHDLNITPINGYYCAPHYMHILQVMREQENNG